MQNVMSCWSSTFKYRRFDGHTRCDAKASNGSWGKKVHWAFANIANIPWDLGTRTYCNGRTSMTIDHKLEYKARKLSTEFHEWMKDPQNHFGIKNVDYIDKVRVSKCKEAKYLSPKIVLLSSLSVFMYIRRWQLASLGAVGKRAASHQHTFEAEHHEITHHSTFGSTLLSFCLKNRYDILLQNN